MFVSLCVHVLTMQVGYMQERTKPHYPEMKTACSRRYLKFSSGEAPSDKDRGTDCMVQKGHRLGKSLDLVKL